MKLFILFVSISLFAGPKLPDNWQQYFELADIQAPEQINTMDALTIVTSDESLDPMTLYIVKDDKNTPTHLIGLNEDLSFNRIDSSRPVEDTLHIKSLESDDKLDLPNVQVYTAEELYTGITVKVTGERQVVRLIKTEQFVIIDYLYSGLTGKRKQMTFVFDHDDHVSLYTEDNELVENLHFVVNKNFTGITLGIKKILINENATDRLSKLLNK